MSVKKKSSLVNNTYPKAGKTIEEFIQPPINENKVANLQYFNAAIIKNVFFASLVIMLSIFLFSGFNIGFHQDEIDMNSYCNANIQFYASGGTDKTYLGYYAQDETKVDSLLRYYGCSFEYLPVLFNKTTGIENGANEYNSRHIFIQLFAVLALLFAGLSAKKLGGWRAALFCIWLLFLTPMFFGHSLMNSKDIPFCTGYIATLYFIIRFLKELPNPSWRNTIYILLSFAFTTGTRIGGVLLLFYLILFILLYAITNKEIGKGILNNIKTIIAQLITVSFGGITLVVVSWPYLLNDPVHHIINTLTVVKRFPMYIPMNFERIFTNSLGLPYHYLPKIIAITLPVFCIVAILFCSFFVFFKGGKEHRNMYMLLLFASIFPIAYAIATHITIYSTWRHFLFTYPSLCVISGIGLNLIWQRLKTQTMRIALISVCFLGMVKPIIWEIKNHPYAYAYFNEIGGSYEKAYAAYETDYWKITMKNTVEWLMKNEPILQAKDTVTISSDMDVFVRYYIKRHYPKAKVKVVLNEFMTRFNQFWTYSIFSKQFLSPDYIETFYPPKLTIHSENIDNLPECIVIKDTARLDWRAKIAIDANNFTLSDSLLTIYINQCPDNVGLLGTICLLKANLNKNKESLKYGENALMYNVSNTSNYNAYCGIGLAYANLRQYDQAIEFLNEAIKITPVDGLANIILADVMKAKSGEAVQ